jgi:hypothetical protein
MNDVACMLARAGLSCRDEVVRMTSRLGMRSRTSGDAYREHRRWVSASLLPRVPSLRATALRAAMPLL